MSQPSPDKAKEILRDGTVHGKSISSKQKRFFGFIAGGGKPTVAGKRAGKKMGNK